MRQAKFNAEREFHSQQVIKTMADVHAWGSERKEKGAAEKSAKEEAKRIGKERERERELRTYSLSTNATSLPIRTPERPRAVDTEGSPVVNWEIRIKH